MPLFCPHCRFPLDDSSDQSDGRVTCPSCRAIFTAVEEPNDTPRVAPPDEIRVTGERGMQVRLAVPPRSRAAHPTEGTASKSEQKAGSVPWYLLGFALLPLIIPAVAIPLHLLVGGLVGGVLWGAVGGGLAGGCLAVARRRTWPRLARLAIALALVGLGFVILLGSLAVQFLFLGPDAAASPLPAVTVEAAYPGANAQMVADTVATHIEQQINGVEGMVAMRSQCGNDGSYTLTITFQRGTDLNMAQVLVQNREALAEPALPDLVKRRGISVKRHSPGVLMIVNVFSPDGSRNALFLSEYASRQLRDRLLRLPGVGDVTFVGTRPYGVRVWLDGERLTAHNLTAAEVVRAIQEQNVQVGAGPMPEGPLALNVAGRPAGVEDFEKIILKAGPGAIVRLKDVAHFELGGGPPHAAVLLDGKHAETLVIHPTPQARPRELRAVIREELERQRATLPAGVEIDTSFDFTANLEAARWQTTPGYLLLDVDLPPGASLPHRIKQLEHCMDLVRQVQGVQGVLAMTDHPFDRQHERACVLVQLGSVDGKAADREPLLRAIRAQLNGMGEVRVRLRDLSTPGRCWGCHYPLELAVHGPEADRVRQFAEKLAGRLRQESGLTDVWAGSDVPAHRELTATVDAAAVQAHGVAMAEIFHVFHVHFDEPWVSDFNNFGRTWQITVKAELGAGDLAGELKKMRVRGADGRFMPLSDFVGFRESEVSAPVERLNGLPMVALTANPAPGVSLAQARTLCEALAAEIRKELGLSADYRLTWL